LAWTSLAQTPHEAKIRDRVLQVGQGAMVDIRLQAGEKLTGRVGPIYDHNFTLEEVRQRKFQDQTIAFADVKSVQGMTVKRTSNQAMHIALIVGISIGISTMIRLIRR